MAHRLLIYYSALPGGLGPMNLNWQCIPTIRAQRLTLRPFEDTDVESLYRIYSDEEVMRYWGGGAFRQFSEAKDFLTEVKEDLKQRRCLQ